jgi:hypothetical protein
LGVAGGVSVDVAAMQLMDGGFWRANTGVVGVEDEPRDGCREMLTVSGDAVEAAFTLVLRGSTVTLSGGNAIRSLALGIHKQL